MLQIYLFGNLHLLAGGQPHRLHALPKTIPLFIYLLLKRHEPVARSALAFLLWPDGQENEAKSNLRRHLHDLKRALPPEQDGVPWLLVDATTVQWNPQADYWLDVAAFEAAAQHQARWPDAVELYTGDLATNLYDDWLFFERERLRNRFLEILTLLVQHTQQFQDYRQAIAYAQRILQHDPMREDVLRTLMTLRFENGDRSGALQEYQRFEQRLREELGVAPMVETNALYDAIARQITPSPVSSPTAPVSSPAPVSAAAQMPAAEPEAHSNLPAQLTSFIGREPELAALRALLTTSPPTARLLTLTGPGGCGKSRLALEVAARIRTEHPESYPGGILFTPLSALSDPGQVLSAMAQTLGVRETTPQTLLPSLKDALRPRRLLLLLDNFEHVVEAAPLLVDLLEAAPGLVMLVTSRVVLRVYGEQEFPLQPLPLPNAEGAVRTDELARCASVALFTTRSRAVRPTFVLNQENAADVAEICIRLDGLPLAIELAAARSKLLAPHALLDRLRSGFAILADHNRHLAQRHQTLHATLEWSYQLLGVREKGLFAQIAVFAGSFAIEAAEEVCAPSADVLAAVEALVDSSLLQQIEVDTVMLGADEPAYYAELRFRMLSVVREYAMRRLQDSGESVAVHRRHAGYYLHLAETAEPQLQQANQSWWQQRLEVEQLNFRSALHFCLEENTADILTGMRLAAALTPYWLYSGYLAEANRWLTAALAGGEDVAPAPVRARVLTALGMVTHAQGDIRRAPPLLEAALTLYRAAGNDEGIVICLYGLSRLAARRNDFAATRRLLDEALTLAAAGQQRIYVSYLLNILAAVTSEEKQFAAAEALYAQALAAARREQNKSQIAFILTGAGEMARLQGDYARAEAQYTEAMRLAHELRQKPRTVMLLHNLGHVALHNADLLRALRLFREAATLGMELPDKENLGMCLLGIGGVTAAQGEHARAAHLFGAGEQVLDSIGARLAAADQMEYDHHRTIVQQTLTPDQYQSHFSGGYSLTFDQAEQLARSAGA